MSYGTKFNKKMYGGMNNTLLYEYFYPSALQSSRIKNGNNNENDNSFFVPENNTIYTLKSPWQPETYFAGIDTSGHITIPLDEEHATREFKGYIFKVREEFVHDFDNDGIESGSMIISIGSSHVPQCIAAELSSESNYSVAKMITLGYDAKCAEYGKLPGEGDGAKIMMSIMQKYLINKRIVAASLFDNAKKYISNTKHQYAESDFYFLSRGEPYYHRYGFYPEVSIESYIGTIIGMKKLTWDSIHESSLQTDVLEKLESLALSCNPLLDYKDNAMQWFSAIWTKNPLYLYNALNPIFTSIAQILNINGVLSIPNFWGTELSMNPNLATRVKEILASYTSDDRKLFYIQNVGKTICVADDL
jgi:hypothetical protein